MKNASLLALASIAIAAHAQPGWVLSHQKISDTQGGFTGILDDADWFGRSVASLGDLDGDGVGGLDAGVLCGHPILFSDFFLSARERSACISLSTEVKFTSGREARVRPAKAGRGLFQAGVMASSV